MTVVRLSTILLAFSLGPQGAALPGGSPAPLPMRGSPPVLSTVPDPPAGVTSEPGQMSGVPLQVGDLPPGIVAVRVIRRTFQDNVSGQTVKLRVGDGVRLLTSLTGADGRAQFEGLNVGDRIQIRAAVGAENLESQQFQVPAQGGVRLVLVAGVGAPIAVGGDWTERQGGSAPAASPGPATPASTPLTTPARSSFAANAWMAGLIGAAFLIVGLVLRARRRPPEAPPDDRSRPRVAIADSRPPDILPARQAPADLRAATFERLVRLEKDHVAGLVSDEAHGATRNALIDELAALDARSCQIEVVPETHAGHAKPEGLPRPS